MGTDRNLVRKMENLDKALDKSMNELCMATTTKQYVTKLLNVATGIQKNLVQGATGISSGLAAEIGQVCHYSTQSSNSTWLGACASALGQLEEH